MADRVLGFRKTIILGAILMAVGYGLMSVRLPEKPQVEQQVVAAEQQLAQARTQWEARSSAAQAAGQRFEEAQPKYQ